MKSNIISLNQIVDELIATYPNHADTVREKPQNFGWFVGMVMKITEGKADMEEVNQILKSKLLA